MPVPLVLDYVPRRLAAAVQKAVELHPGTATAPASIPADGLALLRRRVVKARGNRERLDALARELSPRQVRALVTGLEQWEELRAEAAHLLWARGRAGLVEPLWRSWQRFPRVDAIRMTLLQLAERFGWSSAVGDAYTPLAPRWVKVGEPGVEIQSWLDGQGRSYSDLDALPVPLSADTPLMGLIRAAVLTHGSARQLMAEGVQRLLQWAREIAPAQLVLFRQNYLVKLPSAQWDFRILEPIAAAYGLPRRPRIPGFWAPLPEAVRAEFQRLFIQRRLREAFAGYTDRHEYWTGWMDAIDDIEQGTVAGVDWAVLHFRGFGVWEFFEVGNAAYFYEPALLQSVLAGAPRAVSTRDLKKIYTPSFSRRDNRVHHRAGWESYADYMVNLWTDRTQ